MIGINITWKERNGMENLIKKLSERIGELEVNNVILKMQLEELVKKLEEKGVDESE